MRGSEEAHEIEVQRVSTAANLPATASIIAWARAGLAGCEHPLELTIRIVDAAESQALNARFRHRDAPTNVLSFPFEAPPGITLPILGDIVICAPVVHAEAAEQGKPPEAHWAHMVIHGVLHLRGYDHQTDDDAEEMESLETQLLARLGWPDPYCGDVTHAEDARLL